MGQDKATDDKYFNCNEGHEFDYVAELYPGNEQNVRNFLIKKCASGEINNSPHMAVYELIKAELELDIPV